MNQTHGVKKTRNAIRAKGWDSIDKRSSAYQAVAAARASWIADLGGEENISSMERTLIEQAAFNLFIISQAQRYLAELMAKEGKLWTGRRSDLKFLPLVKEVGELTRGLEATLSKLGLKRRAKPVVGLQGTLARIAEENSNS